MKKTTQAHVPWPGAVLEADGKSWYGKTEPTAYLTLLNSQGEVENAPRIMPNLIGKDYDYNPSDLYICVMCHGTGQSTIVTPEMHEQLKKMNDHTTYGDCVTPLPCQACSGRGRPPIPYGEVK